MKKIAIAIFMLLQIARASELSLEDVGEIRGYCSQEKQKALVEFILEKKPISCVEIGVFEGKSLIPIALALQCNGKGVCIGIDPFSLRECIKNYPSDHAVPEIWEKEDFEKIYHNVLALIERFGVQEHCRVLRMTSLEAAPQIGEIDLLHLDGNHSVESALLDVGLYFSKVRPGGWVCLDDVLRDTTKKAYDIVARGSTLLRSIDNGNCLFFQKKFSEEKKPRFAPPFSSCLEGEFFHNQEPLTALIESHHVKTIIEVGSYLGDATIFMAERLPPGGKIYAVDSWIGFPREIYRETRNVYEQFLSNIAHAGVSNWTVPIRSTSLSAARRFSEYGIKADLIYIDADHSYKAVYSDIEAWSAHLKEGGILCGNLFSKHGESNTIQRAIEDYCEKQGKTASFEGYLWRID